MKKATNLILVTILLFGSLILYPQVAINTDGSPPASSAILDVQSTTKGVLLPRLTNAQRNAISSPAAGLIVYNTSTNRPNIYNDSIWRNFDGTFANSGDPIIYNGQSYNTVLIGNQLWMAENLNIGTMISSGTGQYPNGIIDKWCYNDDEFYCNIYGGLYSWSETMQHVITEGTQGICPPGWHVPTDAEWKYLEGIVDTQYEVGHTVWDNLNLRGYDAGKHLKATNFSSQYIGANTYGFSALPCGFLDHMNEIFHNLGDKGYWQTSTRNSFGFIREIHNNSDKIRRDELSQDWDGYSVRCIKD